MMMNPFEIARAKLLDATGYEIAGRDCEIDTLKTGQAFITWSHRIMKKEVSLFSSTVTAQTIKTPIQTIYFRHADIVTPLKHKEIQ